MIPLEPLKLDIRPIVNDPVEILVGLKKDGDFFGIHPVQLLDQEWEDSWGLANSFGSAIVGENGGILDV